MQQRVESSAENGGGSSTYEPQLSGETIDGVDCASAALLFDGTPSHVSIHVFMASEIAAADTDPGKGTVTYGCNVATAPEGARRLIHVSRELGGPEMIDDAGRDHLSNLLGKDGQGCHRRVRPCPAGTRNA
jgi:hypothetical protein